MPETILQAHGFTAKFDKENDTKQGITISEDFGDEITVPVEFLFYILQEYGNFKIKIDPSEWRGTHGS